MASAYTPGLTVSADIVVRRLRRLPIKGNVLVQVGTAVEPETIVAQALLPGPLQTIRLAEKLSVEAKEVPGFMKLAIGDRVTKGQMVAETKGFLGRFKTQVTSDHEGTIESISEVTGNVLVREASIPVDITAYLHGKVAEVMDGEGAIIETRGAMLQGIFGVGGERTGVIRIAVSGPGEVLKPEHIKADDHGKILIGGAGLTYETLQRASEVGVAGLVAGGIKDADLIRFLGYDIGVAITGQENINITVLVTEGFGFLEMASRTFQLFKSLEGKTASMNGATQIRAGVIRPEIIVPQDIPTTAAKVASEAHELMVGTPIRIIREPYFGALGTVTDLPAQLVVVDSGTEVRVLKAKLLVDQTEVTVPRANVEIIATD